MIKEPAFPLFVDDTEVYRGMTLRDYFAAKSMALTYKFWMEDYYHPDSNDAEFRVDDERSDFDEGIMKLVAADAYKMADEMMKARK